MSCCKLDLPSTILYHKKDFKRILYICNIENYYLKNKKLVIVCEKCRAINNYKSFISTCPNCGKRSKEGKIQIEGNANSKGSPGRQSIPNRYNNLNKLEGEKKSQNNNNYYYQKYLSNYIIKNSTTYTTQNEDNFNNRNIKYLRSNQNYKNGYKQILMKKIIIKMKKKK